MTEAQRLRNLLVALRQPPQEVPEPLSEALDGLLVAYEGIDAEIRDEMYYEACRAVWPNMRPYSEVKEIRERAAAAAARRANHG